MSERKRRNWLVPLCYWDLNGRNTHSAVSWALTHISEPIHTCYVEALLVTVAHWKLGGLWAMNGKLEWKAGYWYWFLAFSHSCFLERWVKAWRKEVGEINSCFFFLGWALLRLWAEFPNGLEIKCNELSIAHYRLLTRTFVQKKKAVPFSHFPLFFQTNIYPVILSPIHNFPPTTSALFAQEPQS